MRSKIILALFTLVLFTVSSFSQKQVTIDRSRLAADRSRKAVAKKAKAAKKEVTRSKRKSYVQRQRKEIEPKLATYLSVNGFYSQYSDNISYSASYRTYQIRTDGQSFNCTALPYWCHVSSSSSGYLYLSVDENYSYDARSDWFFVNSDNQRVKVSITQEGKPLQVTAEIPQLWTYINHQKPRYKGDESKMTVNGSVILKAAKGMKFLVTAFVFDENGNPIKANNGYSDNALNDGTFFAATEIACESDYKQNLSYSITIPNRMLNLGYNFKKKKLYVIITLFNEKTNTYVDEVNVKLPIIAKFKKSAVVTENE